MMAKKTLLLILVFFAAVFVLYQKWNSEGFSSLKAQPVLSSPGGPISKLKRKHHVESASARSDDETSENRIQSDKFTISSKDIHYFHSFLKNNSLSQKGDAIIIKRKRTTLKSTVATSNTKTLLFSKKEQVFSTKSTVSKYSLIRTSSKSTSSRGHTKTTYSKSRTNSTGSKSTSSRDYRKATETTSNSNNYSKFRTNGTGQPGLMRFTGAISCDPLYPDVLLYNRIFKTGSTSISGYIEEVTSNTDITVKVGTTEDWYKTGNPRPYPGHIEKYARISTRLAYIAHFFFRRKLKISKQFTYINIFREPVERVVSHYYYMRNEKLRSKRRIRELKNSGQWNASLLDCVRHQYRGCEDNVMTHFICGTASYCDTGSSAALSRAKRNLKRYYSAVGLLEEVGIFLKILKKRLPSFFIRDHKELHTLKQNKKAHAIIEPRVLDYLRNRNKADIELYNYVKDVYGQLKTKCGF